MKRKKYILITAIILFLGVIGLIKSSPTNLNEKVTLTKNSPATTREPSSNPESIKKIPVLPKKILSDAVAALSDSSINDDKFVSPYRPDPKEVSDTVVVRSELKTVKPKKHFIDAFLDLYYSRIDVMDATSHTSAKALSEINSGVGLRYKYSLNHSFELEVQGEFQKNKMTQSGSARVINNLEANSNRFHAGVNYRANSNFSVYARINKHDLLFLEPSGTDFNLTSKSLGGYGIGMNIQVPFKSLLFTSSLGLDQYLSNYDGSIKILSANSVYGKLGTRFFVYKIPVHIDGYFRQTNFGLNYPQTTSVIEQKTQDLGLIIGLLFAF